MKKVYLFSFLFTFLSTFIISQTQTKDNHSGHDHSYPGNSDYRMISEIPSHEVRNICSFFGGDTLKGFDYDYWLQASRKENIKVLLELENFMFIKQADFVKKKYKIAKLPYELAKENYFKNRAQYSTQKVSASGCSNLDLEDGNLGGWTCSSGYNTNSNGPLTIGGAALTSTNQNIYACYDINLITTAYGNDPLGFPGVDPNGGSYSARLGGFNANMSRTYGGCASSFYWSATYSNGEEMKKTIAVTAANSLLAYDYAVVLNDGGHTSGNQPYFHVTVTNASGVILSSCTEYYVQMTAGVPPPGFINTGFVNTNDNSAIYYKPWSSNSINLTPYIGQNVTVYFSSAGCTAGLHYSRAYVDVICGPAAILASNSAPCVGATVSLTAPPVSGGTYAWSGPGVTGSTTQAVSITSSGTYSVVVTPSQGASCSYTLTKTVNFNPNPVVTSATGTITCSSPTVNVSATTAMSPVSYNWSGTGISSGAGTGTISVTQAGTFNYTVTNTTTGCNVTGSQAVTQNTTAPTVSGAVTGSLNCLTTTVNVSSTTTTTPVSYNWSGPGITAGSGTGTVTVNSGGSYNYTVTNSSNGCKTTGVLSVTQNTTLPSPSASTTGTITCSTNAVTLNGGPGAGVTYTWSGPGITSGANSQNATANAPGVYSLTVTDVNNKCVKTATTSVSQNTVAPIVTSSVSAVLNCTLTSVNVVATTAASPVSYTWTGTGISSGSNQSSATVTQPGTFNYTVTNTSNGCKTTGSQVVTQNTVAPTVTVSPTQTITCAAPTVTISGSATPSTCTPVWTGGVSSGANSYLATASAANVYTLTVTNPSNGCSAFNTVQVVADNNFPSLSSPSISNSITCGTSTAQAVVTSTTSNLTYNWTGTGIVSGATTPTITVNSGGTYSLAVTNTVSGCTSSITAFVPTNTTSPSPVASTTGTLTCAANSLTVALNGNLISNATYTWTGPGVVSGVNTQNAVANVAGVYTLAVTNTVNSCSNTAVTTVVQNTLTPVVTASSTGSLNCSVSTVTVTASTTMTPVSYTWTGTGITSVSNTSVITVNQGGVYSYTVTNTDNSCKTSSAISVTQNTTSPTVSAAVSGSLNCVTSTVNVSATTTTTPVSYNWTGTGITGGSGTGTITVNQGGTFDYTVTNTSNNCVTVGSQAVVQNTTTPVVTASNTGSLNCITTSVNVSATTTTTPVSYNWTGSGITAGSGTGTITVNQGGTYNYTVTNTANSCSVTGSESIIQNTVVPTVSVAPTGSLNCQDLTVNINATSTVTPLSYSWSGPSIVSGSGTSIISVDQGGVYNYTITNPANNCKVINSVTVSQNTITPTATAAVSGSLNCTVNSVSIALTTTTTPVTYNWTGTGIVSGGTSSTVNVNAGGTYTYQVINSDNYCQLTRTVSVIQSSLTPVVTASSTGSLNCSVSTVTVTASTTMTPVSYTWTGAGITSVSNTSVITVNQGGVYSYTVTNTDNSCKTSNTISVTQNTTSPTVSAAVSGSLNCVTSAVNVSATTTTTPVSYNWTGTGITGGSGTGTITVNQGGTFNYTVTNTSNNCVTVGSQAVVQNTTAPTVTASNTGSLNCSTTSVNVSATTTTTPVSYNWTGSGITAGSGTGTITVNQGGTYNYTVTNTANSCSVTGSQAIVQNTVAPIVAASNTGSLNCAVNSVTVAATTTTSPVSYNWSGPGITAGSGTGTITVNQGGTYNYTVTSGFNNCKATGSQAVIQNTTAPTTTASTTGSVTCVNNNINLNSTLAGMNYTWTAPAGSSILSGTNLQNATGSGLGTYTLNVLNPANSCTFQTTIAAIQNTTTPSSVDAGPTRTLVCVTPTLSLLGSATPSTATANWLGGVSSPNTFTTSTGAAGVYTLQAIEPSTGCFISDTVRVLQSVNSPTVTSNPVTNSITCTNSVVAIGVSVTDPSGYTVAWPSGTGISGPTNSVTTTATLTGVYQVTVTSVGNGCISINSLNVPIDQTPVTVSVTPAASITCTHTTETLDVSPVGTNYTYSWTGPSITSGATTTNPIVDAGGNYSVVVTNTINGCSGTDAVNVPIDVASPTVNIGTSSYTTTCSSPNATISITSSPSSNVTYSWTAPATGSLDTYTVTNPVASGSGIFTVVVTNNVNGCSSSLTQNTVEVVPDAALPVVTLSSNSAEITCSVTTPTVNASVSPTSVSYAWTPTLGIVPGTETTATPAFDQAGTYSLVVTNTISGCSTATNANVVSVTLNNTIPTVSLTSAVNDGTLTCSILSIDVTPTITPSSDLTYTWTSSSGSGISTPIDQANATFTTAGTYSLAVTNTVTGCVNTLDAASTFTVYSDVNTPTVSISAISTNTAIGCGASNSTVTLGSTITAANGTNISWLPSGASTPTLDVTVAGVYTLVVVDAVNSCSQTAQYTVTGSTNTPTLVLNPSASMPCGASSTTLSALSTPSTGVNYSWSGPVSATITGSDTATPSVDQTGNYTLTVSDASNGCSATATVDVVQGNVVAAFSANPTTGVAPLDVNFTDASTGATIYNWTFGDGNSSNIGNPSNTFTLSGTYTVTLIASSGACSDTATAVIVVEDGLTLYIPNVFTPNGDGVNDVFTIKSTGVKEISLQIFNRWGEKLYEFAGDRAAWDGRVESGALVPAGTYFFFVKAVGFDNKEIEQHGSLNLFR